MSQEPGNRYVDVILPLKLEGEATYLLSPGLAPCFPGSRVQVNFSGREYTAVVTAIYDDKPHNERNIQYKPVLSVNSSEPVNAAEMEFWRTVADYYMITVGEVYRAAYTLTLSRQESVRPRKTASSFFEEILKDEEKTGIGERAPILSTAQGESLALIKKSFIQAPGKPLLLHGITGSGKTEIYVSLAIEYLQKGRNVLYMVPEIALSKQLQNRLKKYFGKRLLVFHSKQTAAEKARIHRILQAGSNVKEHGETADNREAGMGEPFRNPAVVILGTRSSLFLPFNNLGFIILDEEHDTSYKQSETAPRYHARETAIMLSSIHGSDVVLGSATPSLETLYNCAVNRFSRVILKERYYGALQPEIEIIDTIWARKSGQMKGSFSQKLINLISKTLAAKEQVLIFKNRRSYAPFVECKECGSVRKCPRCNVVLSYHKYDNTLRCHCCDYVTQYTDKCPECNSGNMKFAGAGTEKIEEEISALFPDARVARFDADIAKSKIRQEEIINSFSCGETDILVGTQMISKGFDFEKLRLVAVLDADSIIGLQDFRADEYAAQIFIQLMGRAGRRDRSGILALQTNQKEHPVIKAVRNLGTYVDEYFSQMEVMNAAILKERIEYRFAPYVRMIKVWVKHRDERRLTVISETVKVVLETVPGIELSGPCIPLTDKVRGEWLRYFYIKLNRDRELQNTKSLIKKAVDTLKMENYITIDVDPMQ